MPRDVSPQVGPHLCMDSIVHPRTTWDGKMSATCVFIDVSGRIWTLWDVYGWIDGRGGGIRTPDPLVPNQMRYQTALRPD
jgi:hypothetical protein